jgi:hypothetical protein
MQKTTPFNAAPRSARHQPLLRCLGGVLSSSTDNFGQNKEEAAAKALRIRCQARSQAQEGDAGGGGTAEQARVPFLDSLEPQSAFDPHAIPALREAAFHRGVAAARSQASSIL